MDHRWMETERPSCTVGVKTSNQIYKYRSGYYWAEERKKVALLQNMHSNQREQWWERVIVSDSGTVPGTQAEVPDGTFFSRRWKRKKKKWDKLCTFFHSEQQNRWVLSRTSTLVKDVASETLKGQRSILRTNVPPSTERCLICATFKHWLVCVCVWGVNRTFKDFGSKLCRWIEIIKNKKMDFLIQTNSGTSVEQRQWGQENPSDLWPLWQDNKISVW